MQKVERRGIVTVPSEMNERCWDTTVRSVQGGHLRSVLKTAAEDFVRIKMLEGEEYVDADDIHVYGPFPTPRMIEAMLSNEAMLTGEQAAMCLQRDSDQQAFSHYLLNANFVAASERHSEVFQKGTAPWHD